MAVAIFRDMCEAVTWVWDQNVSMYFKFTDMGVGCYDRKIKVSVLGKQNKGKLKFQRA